MSKETLEWLNSNTLIGYTDDHGNAWHFDGASDNQFTGPVPIQRVADLFDWQAELTDVYVDTNMESPEMTLVEGKKAIMHSGTGDVFNIVSNRYEVHQYNDWLLENVQSILDVADGDLTIGSAGLLRGGGQAWVQVRPPETVQIGGDDMLPWILATTSHDGSLTTQYKGQRQRTVCDNTLAIALGERTAEFRIKHLRGSSAKLGEARQALDIIYTAQSEFDLEIERMMNTSFSNDQFKMLTDTIVPDIAPVIDDDGKISNERSMSNRFQTVVDLKSLWLNDDRVGDYHGTVWGAKQAHNTWFHWNRTHGTGGDETLMKARQLKSTIMGETDTYDLRVDRAIDQILGVFA